LETRLADTTERCFICGIEKNTFNRTLDRDAFRQHVKDDQNLWNYIYFIMYVWEQDKDDDDGFEWYARRCIDENDLSWFPMNKAIRLAEFQERGDVRSMKYRFRKVMEGNDAALDERLKEFKESVNRTVIRVEKALEYETELEAKARSRKGPRGSALMTPAAAARMSGISVPATPSVGGGGGGGGGSSGNGSRSNTRSTRRSSGRGGDELLDTDGTGGSAVETDSMSVQSLGGGGGGLTAGIAADDVSVDSGSFAPPPMQKKTSFKLDNGRPPQPQPQLQAPPQPPAMVSALDMEQMSLMHLRVLSITGLLIVPEYIKYIQVKISSDFDTRVLHPISDVETVDALPTDEMAPGNTNSSGVVGSPMHFANRNMMHVSSSLLHSRKSFSVAPTSPLVKKLRSAPTFGAMLESEHEEEHARRPMEHGVDDMDAKVSLVKLNFDVLENAPLLVHHGPLPKYDLSKVMIKVQVLFNASGDPNIPGIYLAGGRIPLVLLLNKAMEGGVLELVMYQRSVQLKVKHPSALQTQRSTSMFSVSSENDDFAVASFSRANSAFMAVEDVDDEREAVEELPTTSSLGDGGVEDHVAATAQAAAAAAEASSLPVVDDVVDYVTTVNSSKLPMTGGRQFSLIRNLSLPRQASLGTLVNKHAVYTVSGTTSGVVQEGMSSPMPVAGQAAPAFFAGPGGNAAAGVGGGLTDGTATANSVPTSRVEHMSVDDNGQVRIAVSAVASRRLLQDWAMLK
jgi:hypothetical protein